MYLEPHERFKSARTDYNVNGKQTMAQVADATKVPQSVISDLERDPNKDADHPTAPRKVAYQTVAALAKHYGVSGNFLLGLPEDKKYDIKLIAADRLGLSTKAVSNIEEVKDRADNNPYFRRTLDALNSALGNKQLQTLLGYCANAEIAAEKARTAKEQSDAVKKTHCLPENGDYLKYKDTYSYQKYLCVKLFEKMLDKYCKAEDLDK